jgi:fatty-acyl-CoA synthase
MPHQPDTLPAALTNAARWGRRVVVRGPRGAVVETLSWRDVAEQSVELAHRLASTGLAAGERVGLAAETDLAFVRLFLACQLVGLVPLPLPLPPAFGDRAVHAERLALLLEAAGARAAFAPPALLGLLPPGLALAGTPAQVEALPPSPRRLPALAAGDVAFVQFSSGSTRFPKGVVITHRALLANARAIAAALHIVEGDSCVSWLPLYHDMGLVGCLLAPMVVGLDLHLLPTREFIRNPLLWPRLMSEVGGTLSYSPAFGYELASRRVSAEILAPLDLSRWRVAGLGGDMIRPDVAGRFAEAYAPAGFRPEAFAPSYGLAEATLAVTMQPPGEGLAVALADLDLLEHDGILAVTRTVAADGPRIRGFASDAPRIRGFAACGRPLPGMRVEIRDQAGAVVPERRVGRIHVAGPSLLEGYFRDPEASRLVLADGWLDTGDLGAWVDGSLVVTGRAKDLIIVNGRNLWPQDLEWAAERVEPLRPGDVAALAEHDSEGERVVLLVQCRMQDAAARRQLAQAVADKVMAACCVLCRVVLVAPHALPRTSSGKLARSHARRLLVPDR